MEKAGAFAIVIECVPAGLGKAISEAVEIPTIGIGAGVGCDGQILVLHDLLGIESGVSPKFVKRYAEFFKDGVAAARRYRDEVRAGVFPSEEYSFGNVKKSEAPAPASSLSLVRDTHTTYGPKG